MAWWTRSKALTLLALVSIAALSGCAPHAGGPTPSPSPSGTSIIWTSYEVRSPTQLRVHFLARTPACFTTWTDVTETADDVTITVLEGPRQDSPDTCTLDAHNETADVTLSKSIGDRLVRHAPVDAPLTSASPPSETR